MTRMKAEHWILLAGLLSLLGVMEPNVTEWADLLNVKTVLKFAGASGLLVRAAFVPTTERP